MGSVFLVWSWIRQVGKESTCGFVFLICLLKGFLGVISFFCFSCDVLVVFGCSNLGLHMRLCYSSFLN